jgi:hypothetical protein
MEYTARYAQSVRNARHAGLSVHTITNSVPGSLSHTQTCRPRTRKRLQRKTDRHTHVSEKLSPETALLHPSAGRGEKVSPFTFRRMS